VKWLVLFCTACVANAPPPPAEVPRVVEKPAQRVMANGIELAWESFGDEKAPVILLVMGLGMQMIGWPEAFCTQLAARGYRVVRFDNRDVGLSTHFTGDVNPLQVFDELRRKKPVQSAYLLADMANDAFGLLDALGIEKAHVAGVSMGGMIAQQMAIARPERVASLTSIMSTTGDPDVKGPTFEVLTALLEPFPPERAAFVERSLKLARTVGTPGGDETAIRALAARSFDRSYAPMGPRRQLVAIWASGSRKAALGSLKMPVMVVHGQADPLIPVDGGRATAAAVPGARLEIIAGMGHDLPRAHWLRVIDAIVQAARGW
jgi:pimeloyl-ACP methyl ester carboxylesterase